MKKHQKHAKLVRPELGEFGRCELSIIGTPCGEIKRLANLITSHFAATYKIAFVDADHRAEGEELAKISLGSGAQAQYTDKIDWQRWEQRTAPTQWERRTWFQNTDLVLVNGNHFAAAAQIVVVDAKKADSLHRKIDRLTNVQLIILQVGETVIPDWLKKHLGASPTDIPIIKMEEVQKLLKHVGLFLESYITEIQGLILAGGKSTRMGEDKSQIAYHGVPQTEYLAALLNNINIPAFQSVQKGTGVEREIVDTFTGLGPYGAILSAFRQNPNVAWLVIACDLPFVDEAALTYLLKNRNPSKLATAFHNPATAWPDPLLTIWEPRSYPVLLQWLGQGYSCPRKVLINSEIELLNYTKDDLLRNANTPAERAEIERML